MKLNKLEDLNVIQSKSVLLRADLDVPINDNLEITDLTRVKACIPTIKYLIEKGAKVAILTKIGRPEEKRVSTKILAKPLEDLTNNKVLWVPYCTGPNLYKSLNASRLLLLENVRFHKEEEEANSDFAKKLSAPFDIYVNEAFAMCHRRDASISILPTFLPSYAGFRLIEEYETLTNLLKNPQRPFIAIIGGAKVETKLPVIENLIKLANKVLVGGKIAFELPPNLLRSPKILTASDDINHKDIGPKTIEVFKKEIAKAKTIVWSGPMGIFETPPYDHGTNEIAQAVAKSGAYKVIGGGDTILAVSKAGVLDKMDFVSTGGGAMLTLLSGKPMPGIIALEQN